MGSIWRQVACTSEDLKHTETFFFSRQGFHRHSDVLRVPFARGDSAACLSFFLPLFFFVALFEDGQKNSSRSGLLSVFDCSSLISDRRPKWEQTPPKLDSFGII